ncbi:MAG: PAS domain-containing protein, partial [Pseudomonadota bacterium]
FVIVAAFAASDQNDRRALSEFRRAVDAYQAEVESQLRSLQAVTLGMAAGAATDNQPMTRARFDRMATALTGGAPPSALGSVALLDRTDSRDVPAALSAMRRQYPESDLPPEGTGPAPDERLLVRNRWPAWMAYDAIGRDVADRLQPVASAIEAHVSRSPMLSGLFVEKTPDGPITTYVMMAPVIPVADAGPGRKSAPPYQTASGAGVGQWVSTIVLAEELFRRPIAPVDARIAVHVVDVDAPDSSLQVVFDSHQGSHTVATRFSEGRTLSALGRTWRITYATTPAFEAANRDRASFAIGLSGLLVGCGVLLVMLRLRRAERAASAEQALSEARFERLNSMLPIGVFEVDATGRLTRANEAACLLAAVPAARLAGRGHLRRISAADRRWLLDTWRAFTTDGEPFRVEHRLHGDDGRDRWILTEIVPQEGHDGMPGGFVGTCMDISDRREFELDLLDAQQRAIAAEARLVAAIDAMDSAFTLYGPDERLVISNAKTHGFFGSRAGEVRRGMHRDEVLHLLYESLSGGTDPQGEEALRNRRDALAQATSSTVEERIGERWFRVTRRRTSSGDVMSLRSEITRQRSYEQEIQKLAAVASQIADGVALLDRQGRIQWVNAAYERLTGFTLDEIRGRR